MPPNEKGGIWMKTARYHFKWFEKEDGRKRLRASIGEDGKLRIGRTLRTKLPQYIRIGFDENNLTLAIADGHGIGIRCPACGVITVQALSAQIRAIGFRLPVTFELTRNEQTGYLVGKIVPHHHTNKAGQRQFDAEELLAWGKPIVSNAVRQMAKSTPLADRRSVAKETLLTAAQNYRPQYGDLAAYLAQSVRSALQEENRRYGETFACQSLDQPLRRDAKEDGTLYDMISDGEGWAESLELRLDAERFCTQLSSQEQDMVRMLQEGFQMTEIEDVLGISEQDLRHLACEIARKKRKFDAGI